MPRSTPTSSKRREPTDEGLPQESSELFSLLYDAIHKQAGVYMRDQPRGHTLQPTALANEAYLRLDRIHPGTWRSREHFLAMSSSVMTKVLADYARRRCSAKRRAEGERVPLEGLLIHFEQQSVDMIDLEATLTGLAELGPHGERGATIVQLRAYGGLTMQEIASTLGTPKRTVEREFHFARAWLHRELGLPTST